MKLNGLSACDVISVLQDDVILAFKQLKPVMFGANKISAVCTTKFITFLLYVYIYYMLILYNYIYYYY